MDVVRVRRRPAIARALYAIAGIVTLIVVAVWSLTVLFAQRGENAPSVVRDSLAFDTVTRGTLERSVAAAGVFAPDHVRIVATIADGIITELPVRPGTRVAAETIIARLANPDLTVAVADANAQLAAALADVRSVREEAAGARLDEDTVLRSARAEDARAAVEARADADLHAQGLVGDLQYRSALIKSSEERDLVALARSKVTVGAADARAKIAAAAARVDQLSATLAARRAQLETLAVRAGAPGIVQSVAIDCGQRVTSGTELARIADRRDLKAVLAVAESDARGVAPGQRVRITASDTVTTAGTVSRLAPAAANGTVAVDVALDRIPQGARSDQNLDGTIVLSRFPQALSLARPAAPGDAPSVRLYRLDRSGTRAYRTDVSLASGSDDRVRVIAGLTAGDRVIVSDTSAFTAPVLRIQR